MKRVRLNSEIFKTRCIEKHGGKYDYSKVVFTRVHDPVIIICPIHGEFSQNAWSHLNGIGCKQCGVERGGNFRRKSQDQFIIECKKIHGGRYDYTRVIYKNANSKISIVCSEHGMFEQTPHMHLTGQGCPICNAGGRVSGDKKNDLLSKINERLISRNIIALSLGDDVTRARFKCQCGYEWITNTNNVLNKGTGCSRCANVGFSSGEDEIGQFLSDLDVVYNVSDRKLIAPLELDVIIPSKKIAIEYNGVYWHSEQFRNNRYHLEKRLSTEKAGYRLISIRADLWTSKRNQIQNILLNALGYGTKSVYARITRVVQVNVSTARDFLNQHHIQGYRNASQHWGLQYNDELIAVMSVTHWQKKNNWELVRYATACNVPGGLSKLWKRITIDNDIHNAYSYVDRDLFTGKSYSKAGFIYDSTTVGFRIANGKNTESRQQWNNAPDGLTQTEWYKREGVCRIYDSGQDKLIWKSAP